MKRYDWRKNSQQFQTWKNVDDNIPTISRKKTQPTSTSKAKNNLITVIMIMGAIAICYLAYCQIRQTGPVSTSKTENSCLNAGTFISNDHFVEVNKKHFFQNANLDFSMASTNNYYSSLINDKHIVNKITSIDEGSINSLIEEQFSKDRFFLNMESMLDKKVIVPDFSVSGISAKQKKIVSQQISDYLANKKNILIQKR